MRTFTKTYTDPQLQQRTLAHYRWIARTNPNVRIPQVLQVRSTAIDFEHLEGRHGTADDLLILQPHLGGVSSAFVVGVAGAGLASSSEV
ncbi:hypothetical protein ACFWNL_03015 [Kitasatospora sp. NPDC058397]|uniref:hypothetical protein n=1 Tax=unclassified Kitasatospora TaxID=2633591 RepID=UPI0036465DF6